MTPRGLHRASNALPGRMVDPKMADAQVRADESTIGFLSPCRRNQRRAVRFCRHNNGDGRLSSSTNHVARNMPMR